MTYENRFLDTLDPDDLQALKPHLARVSLSVGQVLIQQQEEVSVAHFPADARLANVIVFEHGGAIETSVVGSEGVSGLAPWMADAPCTWRVMVRQPGTAWACATTTLRRLASERPSFMAHLLCLTHHYQAQAAQTAACNASHKALARVARWLLMADDLSPGARVRFTQEELATLLGAQRTTINDAATRLKEAKAISYGRGSVTIRNRPLLETYACECYRMQQARTRPRAVS
jgi:CRP-like cAMP-binding protein